MHDANVGATHRILDAAVTAGVERLVYVSTVNVLGNTHGRIARRAPPARPGRRLPELLRRDQVPRPSSGRRADRRRGPGRSSRCPASRYGPRDHSGIGEQLRGAYDGTLGYVALGELGISAVYVEDVAAGIVAALDRGRIGESYVLGGENTRLRDAMRGRGAARRQGPATPGAADGAPAHRLEGARPSLARAAGPARRPRGGAALEPRRDVLGVVGQGRDRARLSAARPRQRPARHVR